MCHHPFVSKGRSLNVSEIRCVSDNPEQDWKQFQDAMKYILAMPNKCVDDLKPDEVGERPAQSKPVRNTNLNG